ncbi:MAG: oligosaccharide flippase family protein [Bryobacteraceae bacterium]
MRQSLATLSPAATMNATAPVQGARRYITNILWTWLGVAVGILFGFVVTPYVIRKIGDKQFSIWTLTLSLVEYYWLIDFGLRSATVKLSAEYHTLKNHSALNTLVNTGLAYSTIAGCAVALFTIAFAPHAGRFFNINEPVFPELIRIIGVSWAVGLVFNIFGACIEGFQRFDIFGRIWVSTTVLRTIGVVLVLNFGFGVLQMGIVLLCSQLLVYALNYLAFRRLAPEVRISLSLARISKLKEMASYGVHSLRVLVSDRLLRQSAPVLIPYFLPIQFLAYYSVPMRILDYLMDGIGRVGTVTTPNATQLMATGRRAELINLGVYANRYSLALFVPVTVFLLVFGSEIYGLWIRPDFAAQSAYLLPAFLFGHTLASSQFNSGSILFGLGRHQTYSKMLLAEAILTIIGMILVLPRFGLLGAAWVSNGLMALNRGGVACLLICRELGVSAWRYALRIYTAPCTIGVATFALLFWLKRHGLPGRNWHEIVEAGVLMIVPYALATYFFCLPVEHRAIVARRVQLIVIRARS